jgi:hypothetical protein
VVGQFGTGLLMDKIDILIVISLTLALAAIVMMAEWKDDD